MISILLTIKLPWEATNCPKNCDVVQVTCTYKRRVPNLISVQVQQFVLGGV